MPIQQTHKSGGAGKHGRNRESSQNKAYKIEGRREKNKIKKIKRHIRRNQKMVERKTRKGRFLPFPASMVNQHIDKQAVNALKRQTA